MDNASFGDNDSAAAGIEMASLLRAVGAHVGCDGVIFDSNGNRVGAWSIR